MGSPKGRLLRARQSNASIQVSESDDEKQKGLIVQCIPCGALNIRNARQVYRWAAAFDMNVRGNRGARARDQTQLCQRGKVWGVALNLKMNERGICRLTKSASLGILHIICNSNREFGDKTSFDGSMRDTEDGRRKGVGLGAVQGEVEVGGPVARVFGLYDNKTGGR